MIAATRASTKMKTRQLLDLAVILRNRYNLAVTIQEGEVIAVDRVQAPAGQGDRYIGATAEDVLAQIPPSDADIAWQTVCDAVCSGRGRCWVIMEISPRIARQVRPSSDQLRCWE